MDAATLLETRLRSHGLTAPARDPVAAADRMLAVQAQEFWGGRWALAVRTRGEPTLTDVDAAFDRGDLVRAWTMRGTIHVIPARALSWVLSVTGARQLRQAASSGRRIGLPDDVLDRVEREVRRALAGGGRITRAEFGALLQASGTDPGGGVGYHALFALSARGVICHGPVVPREGAPTREQYFVLTDDWIDASAAPSDPVAELFVRFVGGHGPAGAADFARWAGLPITAARRAAAASADRLAEVAPGLFAAPDLPAAEAGAAEVIALGSFDEYLISYVDRAPVCAPELARLVVPGKNGLVRPVLLARGEIVGVWSHSKAVGRHIDPPRAELAVPGAAADDEIAAALGRYARFIVG